MDSATTLMAVDPSEKLAGSAGLYVMLAMPPPAVAVAKALNTANVTLGVPLVGVAVVLLGHTKEGGATSLFMMLKLHVLTLLALSVALQLTLVTPRPTLTGDVALHVVAVLIPELSVAVGTVNATGTIVVTPPLGITEMADGHVSAGAAPSAIVNGNVQLPTLPALSVAVHVTLVVVNTVNRVTPEAGHTKLAMPLPSVALTLDRNDTSTSGRMSVLCVVYV